MRNLGDFINRVSSTNAFPQDSQSSQKKQNTKPVDSKSQ